MEKSTQTKPKIGENGQEKNNNTHWMHTKLKIWNPNTKQSYIGLTEPQTKNK